MIDSDVIHDGKRAVVIASRVFPFSGLLMAIQQTKDNGEPYSHSERPDGFKQRMIVKPEDVEFIHTCTEFIDVDLSGLYLCG